MYIYIHILYPSLSLHECPHFPSPSPLRTEALHDLPVPRPCRADQRRPAVTVRGVHHGTGAQQKLRQGGEPWSWGPDG